MARSKKFAGGRRTSLVTFSRAERHSLSDMGVPRRYLKENQRKRREAQELNRRVYQLPTPSTEDRENGLCNGRGGRREGAEEETWEIMAVQ